MKMPAAVSRRRPAGRLPRTSGPNTRSQKAFTIAKALVAVVSNIPRADEARSNDPHHRARQLARAGAVKAATISGSLSLPPGPFGLATIVPDLLAIWHLQRAMVANIAAIYGKSAFLGKETMAWCLFKHGAAAVLSDVVVRAGSRVLVRPVTVRGLQRVLERVGLHVSRRVLANTLARIAPLVGAVGVGAYAYYDTAQVAANAIELFSRDIETVPEPERFRAGKLRSRAKPLKPAEARTRPSLASDESAADVAETADTPPAARNLY